MAHLVLIASSGTVVAAQLPHWALDFWLAKDPRNRIRLFSNSYHILPPLFSSTVSVDARQLGKGQCPSGASSPGTSIIIDNWSPARTARPDLIPLPPRAYTISYMSRLMRHSPGLPSNSSAMSFLSYVNS